MKSFRTYLLTAVAVLALAMTMTACSKSSSDDGGGTVSAITTTTQGQQAASTSSQSASMAQGSGTTFNNLGSIGLSATGASVPAIKPSALFKPSPAMKTVINASEKFAKSSAAKAAANSIKRAVDVAKAQGSNAPTTHSGTASCADGGSYTFDVTADSAANTFSATLNFATCREDDTQTDGLYKLTGSWTDTNAVLAITLGNSTTAFTMMEYGPSYSGLISKTTMEAFSLGYTVSSSSTTAGSFDIQANGIMKVHNYFSSDDYSLEFKNGYHQLLEFSATGTGAASSFTFAMTTNGDFTESWTAGTTANSVAASFQEFKLSLTLTSTYDEVNINGKFSITFTPESCMNGTFNFVTTTPIRTNMSDGKTYQGVVTINDAVTITFNANGTVTVTVAGVAKTYTDEFELSQLCPVATMDEPAPVSSGPTGTSSGGITATLTWDSPDSDMDFHLAHYVTKPTGTASLPSTSTSGVTTNSDWHLYFGTGPGGACTSGNYIGTSANPIAEYDIDDCSGYGPEHITLATPPSGYYILFVDPYSMGSDNSSTVDVSLQVGDKLFTFASHNFTSSSDATYKACAFTVDASGNVTVETSMTTDFAPAKRAQKF